MSSWSKQRPNTRLMSLSLPRPIANQLLKEKARSGKSMTGIICEALIEKWQAAGVMGIPPVQGVPSRLYVPPAIYPPQPPSSAPVMHAPNLPPVVPNPNQGDIVRDGPWRGYRVQPINRPKVPPWNL